MVDAARPQVTTLDDGRIAVFVGGRYAYLPLEAARAFSADLRRAVRDADRAKGGGR